MKKLGQLDRSVLEQDRVEASVLSIYKKIFELASSEEASSSTNTVDKLTIFSTLLKDSHAAYLYRGLVNTGSTIRHYDSGHPWIIYWSVHGLNMLKDEEYNIENQRIKSMIIKFLSYCQDPEGGFCGGHLQLPHVASTYAAVLALIEVGGPAALGLISREKMYRFFLKMRNPEVKGSFLMHERGEADMRSIYIVVVLAKILNILSEELVDGVVEFISSCQTYEGGLAGDQFTEAHGGYTYCGYAALCALGANHKLDQNRLLYWACKRQLAKEGGFHGRTNKVVDACYSFWQGTIFNLLNKYNDSKCNLDGRLLYDQERLQMYLLFCCQDTESGGMIDKPGKCPDLYHTSYAISGLSTSQNHDTLGQGVFSEPVYYLANEDNKVEETDIIYNVRVDKLKEAEEYFKAQPRVN